ncbi:MAG: glycoside hydrolase family 2 protein [Rectinema sp.]
MEIINLASEWDLVRLADSSVRRMQVPGDIYSTLIHTGELPDPYFGENEPKVQWPGREDWKLERRFWVPDHFLRLETIKLLAEVIDTVADVYLNGVLIGTSENMFRRFEADTKAFLHSGENTITIIIHSPEEAAIHAAQKLPYPIPASIYPVSSPHRNLIRKAQCMSGWDWGPCLMTGGIYDGIALIATDGPFIRAVQTRIKPLGNFDGASVRGPDFSVEIAAEVDVPEPMDIQISCYLDGVRTETEWPCRLGSNTVRIGMDVRAPKLWWPHGRGSPALYDFYVTAERTLPHGGIVSTDGLSRQQADSASRVVHASQTAYAPAPPRSPHIVHKRIGFRELKVVTEKDKIGRSFMFVVNGKEVFAKGANWIPADALPSRWTRTRIASLLDSAVKANMNCLRVWGGGRYESDDFYELCDERGIMVWQDCMFSCALYPSSPEFLANVEAEIAWQVKRLSDHPCIALWCGNNEALGAIGWYEESKHNPARYIIDYDRLTEGVLGRVIRSLDPDRCFWPSSPSAGPNDFSDNWHSDERGDMHFWSVWHEGKPFSEYLTVRPRFCSEFGFQSLPSMRTIASFAPKGEYNISAPIIEAHQKDPHGNRIIIDTMLQYFRMPKCFRQLVYLSQVQQAMAIRTAVEFWRSTMPRCMGTLFWQLNDVWPAISWSSLNYDGSWKLLQYEMRRVYAPVLLALFVKDGMIQAHLISETPGMHRAEVTLRLLDFHGEPHVIPEKIGGEDTEGNILSSMVPRTAVERSLLIAEHCVQAVWTLPLDTLHCRASEVFLEASLEVPDLGIRTKTALLLTEPKHCALEDPGLEVEIMSDSEGTLELAICAREAPAFYVAAEFDDIAGQFEDAGFYCAKGERQVLRFIPSKELSTLKQAPRRAGPSSSVQSELYIYHLQKSFEH